MVVLWVFGGVAEAGFPGGVGVWLFLLGFEDLGEQAVGVGLGVC